MAPVQPRSLTERRSSVVAMPPDAMIEPRAKRDKTLVERQVRTVQEAVALDGGHLERA